MLKYDFVQIDYNGLTSLREKRKIEHDLAYSTLNTMLDEIGIELYEILRTENGKPYLKDEDIHFSISHTDGLVAVCLSDTPVGIDCEKIDKAFEKKIPSFAKRYFLENEIKLLEENGYDALTFFKIWTGKEAYIKKYGLNASHISKIDTTKEVYEIVIEGDYIITILK